MRGGSSINTKEIRSSLNQLQPQQHFNAYPVSNRVNNPGNDDIQCIEAS
ncbi:MAG: hypothetical protein WC109_10280 [Syntrophomonadaceae bacterium]